MPMAAKILTRQQLENVLQAAFLNPDVSWLKALSFSLKPFGSQSLNLGQDHPST